MLKEKEGRLGRLWVNRFDRSSRQIYHGSENFHSSARAYQDSPSTAYEPTT